MMPKRVVDRPLINLDQLAAQLKKFEGQVIHNAAGLAVVIMMGAETDAQLGGSDGE
jgi:hypothetical protein